MLNMHKDAEKNPLLFVPYILISYISFKIYINFFEIFILQFSKISHFLSLLSVFSSAVA